MLPNIYLSDLGVNSIDGSNINTIIAYIALMRILSLICNADALTIVRFSGLFSILSIILSYSLLSSVVLGGKRMRSFVSYVYPIIIIGLDPSIVFGYISGFTLVLSIVILFFILNESKKENYFPMFITGLVSWIALGFFWHTIHVVIYLIIISHILITKFNERDGKWNFFILISIIFIATWIYMRENIIEHTLYNPYIDFNLSTLYLLFQKGSTAGQYSFKSALPIGQIKYIRYFSYVLAYGTMIILIRKRGSKIHYRTLIASLLVSEIIFQIIYFIGSGNVGPRVLIPFSLPLLLIILNGSHFKNRLIRFVPILLILPILITAISGSYTYLLENPASNLNDEIYTSGFSWTTEHFDEIQILSDSQTIGYYKLLYASSETNNCKMQVVSINSKSYGQIVDGIYRNSANKILVLNIKLYEKHLLFGSLEDWNTFEPLDPYSVMLNKLIFIYDDGKVMIFK